MTLNAADMLAVLAQMTADLPQRPDLRGADAIAEDMRLEQLAEDKAAAKRGDHDGEGSRAWAARRWAG